MSLVLGVLGISAFVGLGVVWVYVVLGTHGHGDAGLAALGLAFMISMVLVPVGGLLLVGAWLTALWG